MGQCNMTVTNILQQIMVQSGVVARASEQSGVSVTALLCQPSQSPDPTKIFLAFSFPSKQRADH